MKSLSVGLVILLAVSVAQAEKWAIISQYASSSCDHNKVYLFTSTAESACYYDPGGSFYRWNCSDGNPQRMMCSDNKCTQSCVALPTLKYNSSACNPYVTAGLWYNGFCADMENPFTNLKIKLTRRYFNTTDCQQQRNLTDTVGASLECFNTSASASTYSSCGGSSVGLYVCSDAVCGTCAGPFNSSLRTCVMTYGDSGIRYETDTACGNSGTTSSPTSATTTSSSTSSPSPSPSPTSTASTSGSTPTPTPKTSSSTPSQTSGSVPITTGGISASSLTASAVLVTLALTMLN